MNKTTKAAQDLPDRFQDKEERPGSDYFDDAVVISGLPVRWLSRV
jgi:hypothetical protein